MFLIKSVKPRPLLHLIPSSIRQQHSQNTGSSHEYDLAVIGGGIVGVASAREILCRNPKLKVAILEKENKLAAHQTGHNSGVIHAGIYYTPGTLKAKLCVEGMNLIYRYCDEKNIPYKKCGKLIVATEESEVERLMNLYDRGLKNKVPDLKVIDESEIPEIEPYCEGIKAIWSPHTGIVDFAMVTRYYSEDFKKLGGHIHLNFKVTKFMETPLNAEFPVTIRNKVGQDVRARYVLTCGGLQSDQLAELTGCPRAPRIVPIRGEYLLLHPSKAHMVKGNIYPVPDPRLPFLGVHFTPRMDGSIWLGPNAVLAFKREGYTWSDINIAELFDAIRYPGFLKLGWKHLGFGLKEIAKSALIAYQMKDLQRYIPEITEYDVSRGPAGIRAQALDVYGNLVDDFVFDKGSGGGKVTERVLHCRNAPSPGATSSMAIAKMVADKIQNEFKLY